MNSESDFADFKNCTVAIWGLGLIGGSLAYALSGKCQTLIGIDPDQETIKLAKKSEIFDWVSSEPKHLISKADIVILAAPVCAILEQINLLPELHEKGCVVFDLGSTKKQIVDALSTLPSRFIPLGGHPMCGSEYSSFQHADPELFNGATFALVEMPRTTAFARKLAVECVQTINAIPYWLDANTHDRLTAMSSHMPYLISNALASSIPVEAKPLAGSGLYSTSRLAASSPAMMLDILKTNQESLIEALQLFRANLSAIENDIRQGNFKSLETKLHDGHTSRLALFE